MVPITTVTRVAASSIPASTANSKPVVMVNACHLSERLMHVIKFFIFFQKSPVPMAFLDDNATIHFNVPFSNKFSSLENSGPKIALNQPLSSIDEISVAVACNKVSDS